MNRSYSDSATVISLKPLGENNQSVTLLTKSKGIVYATLYGGPKSRLRSLVSQWHSGTIFLYDNPEKNQIKISDFDVKNYHVSFGENLFKNYAASLACELAIKTRCAGSPENCWHLINGFLDGLELANEDQGHVGLIRFLWRFLAILGLQPEVHCCGHCGKSFLEPLLTPDSKTYYNIMENSFICADCFSQGNAGQNFVFSLELSALRYLTGITVLEPAEARKLKIDRQEYNQLKELVFFLIENAAGTKLNTIEIGVGIL
ncbi:DNA repair protein RecO [Treponema sp. C6A8]|uniref:DNA repair protein RecO n=1 Tax=Treponema sp. C6A8 TaxID=1410609 RepID=UPI000B29B0ED|nr:DNA repair protein RecO [Treponema sp. C6A8]